MPFTLFAPSPEPLAYVLKSLNHPAAAALIGMAAVIAMPTVIMVFMFGQSRVFFAMARDGLLPRRLSSVNKRGVPVTVTVLTGLVAAVISGLMPLDEIASLANAGTLAAFIATATAVMVLRRRSPELERPFVTPLVWLVGPATILGCAYLFTSLQLRTIEFFVVWNVIGFVLYAIAGTLREKAA